MTGPMAPPQSSPARLLLPLRTRPSGKLPGRAAAVLALLAVLAPFPFGVGSSSASQVVTSQTFAPVADVFVSSSKPNSNYGNAPRLKMDHSPVLTTYVRFNLSNLPDPVTQATLQVFSRSSSSTGFDVRAVADNTWAENAITYVNAPAFSSTSAGSSGPVKSGTWTTLDITPLITGNGAVSIALTTPSTAEVDVDSRQGARSPKLSVETASSAPGGDVTAPTAPGNLSVTSALASSLALSWSASTDDTGVTGYDVFLNGSKVGSAAGTGYTFGSLACGTSYTLGMEAFDAAANHSTLASVVASTAACPVSTGSAPAFRYAYFGDSDPTANKNLGATLIDVGSRSSADSLPAGTQGMVWVGDYDNTTCSWAMSDSALSSAVTAAKGDAKVYGWFISDEPNPLACPNAPAQHKVRSDLIHSIDPNTKTFVVLDSNGFAGNLTQDAIDQLPLWVGTADFIGLDPYPCLVNKSCDYSFINSMIAKADATGIPYVGVLQAFDGTAAGEEFRQPTASELQSMVNLWAASHEVGSAYFAWDWPAANWYLSAHPDLESVIQNFYTGSSSVDTTAPTAPGSLSKTAAAASSISLSWTASTDNVGVTGYNVYNESTLAGSTSSLSYTVGSLACGTSYTFGVEAKDAAGNVSTRSTVAAFTSACPTTTAPLNVTLPTISGTASVNSVLSATTGTWSNNPTGYADQWERCDAAGANCIAIAGATAGDYTLISADQGLTLRVVASATNAAGSTSATSVQTALISGTSTAADPTLVAAGDICGSPTDCAPTAALIGSINPALVVTLGDNAYTTGSAADFATNYDPNWGKYRSITKPAPGNHEYDYGNQQTGYFAYFNNPPAYYSYDVGTWHLISLNGELSASGGSAQETWLKNDLAAHKNTCTLAYWHEPRWSSGYHGGDSYYGTFWTDLYNGGADIVLNGHDHDYERFAPQNPNGSLDTTTGIREFVVGTGGDSHYAFNAPTANSEVRDSTSFGVLKLTLHATGYDWKFVPISGAAFTDSGSGSCH